MTTTNDDQAEFERRASAALAQSVDHIDGRIRSRLTQARHAALAHAVPSKSAIWRRPVLVPAGAAAALALAIVAAIAWQQKPARPTLDVEDVELLADSEALELMQDEDVFYEWAVRQGTGT
jgi:hypothetical protein